MNKKLILMMMTIVGLLAPYLSANKDATTTGENIVQDSPETIKNQVVSAANTLQNLRTNDVATMAISGNLLSHLKKNRGARRQRITNVVGQSVTTPAQPVTPPKKSVTPLDQPVTPLDQPVTPPKKSVTPLDQSVTTPEKSVTPLDQPVTPLDQPVTPPKKSVTPLDQSVTTPEKSVTPIIETLITPEDSEIIEEVAILPDTKKINDIQFNNDGTRIVVASADGSINIYDNTYKRIRTIVETAGKSSDSVLVGGGHSESVNSARFSVDGNYIITASDDTTSKIFNTETGHAVKTIQEPANGKVVFAELGPDGEKYLIVSDNGNLITGNVKDDKGGSVVPSKTSRSIKSIWKRAQDAALHFVEQIAENKSQGLIRFIKSAHFHPKDSNMVIAARNDGLFELINLETDKIKQIKHSASAGSINSAHFNPDGTKFITADSNHIKIWDTATQKLEHSFRNGNVINKKYQDQGESTETIKSLYQPTPKSSYSIQSAEFDSSGRKVLAVLSNKDVIIWNLSAKQIKVFNDPNSNYSIISSKLSPDKVRLATLSQGFKITIYNTITNDIEAALQIITKRQNKELICTINAINFNHDGSLIAAGLQSFPPRIWSIQEKGVAGTVKDIVTTKATNVGSSLYGTAAAAASKIYDTATSAASGIYDTATSTVKSAYDTATSTATGLYEGATKKASDIYTPVKNWFSSWW